MFTNVLWEVRGASTQCFLSSARIVNVILGAGMGSLAKRVSLVLCWLDRPQGAAVRRNRFIYVWGDNDLH